MDDTISRAKAIDALRNYLVGKNVSCDGTMMARLIENEVINKLPSAQPTFDARDTQYNLPIGTDCISRQAAIDKILGQPPEPHYPSWYAEQIKELPSAQPEIIRCRECKFASGDSRICMKFDHSPIGELDFCAWAERKTDERHDQQTGGDRCASQTS